MYQKQMKVLLIIKLQIDIYKRYLNINQPISNKNRFNMFLRRAYMDRMACQEKLELGFKIDKNKIN